MDKIATFFIYFFAKKRMSIYWYVAIPFQLTFSFLLKNIKRSLILYKKI